MIECGAFIVITASKRLYEWNTLRAIDYSDGKAALNCKKLHHCFGGFFVLWLLCGVGIKNKLGEKGHGLPMTSLMSVLFWSV